MSYAIVDSGTSLMYLPPTDYALFKQIVINAGIGQNDWLNCNSIFYPNYCYSNTHTCSSFMSHMSPI